MGGPRHPRIWPSLSILSDPKSSDKALVQEQRAKTRLLSMLLGSPDLLIGNEATWWVRLTDGKAGGCNYCPAPLLALESAGEETLLLSVGPHTLPCLREDLDAPGVVGT